MRDSGNLGRRRQNFTNLATNYYNGFGVLPTIDVNYMKCVKLGKRELWMFGSFGNDSNRMTRFGIL